MQLLEEWNNLRLSDNSLQTLQKIDELIYDLDKLGCKTSQYREFYKFKEIFKDK